MRKWLKRRSERRAAAAAAYRAGVDDLATKASRQAALANQAVTETFAAFGRALMEPGGHAIEVETESGRTFTATVHHGSNVLSAVSSFTGIEPTARIFGVGIPADTTIAGVDPMSRTVAMSQPATLLPAE